MKPLIIFGPSGVGKGTIIKYLSLKNPQLFKLSVSYTTRRPRPKQIDGIDYFFVTKQQFDEKVKKNEMLQHKLVFGNYYGTCKKNIQDIIQDKKLPILDVDVQGMLDIKNSIQMQNQKQSPNKLLLRPLSLCILPPNLKLLRQRLKGRKTESQQIVQKRMKENLSQLQKIISLQNNDVYYVTNYQYQLTVYGIQYWLKEQHNKFKLYKQQMQRKFAYLI